MPVPSSTKFDIIDWNIRADTTSYVSDALLSDPVEEIDQYAFIPYPTVVTSDGFTTLLADGTTNSLDTVIKSVLQVSDHLPAAVPSTFTFEFDVYLSDALPKSFADPDDRVFIGAINQQGYTAGFLFSYDGIALAAYPEDPTPTVLAGSKDLILDDAGMFIPGVNIRAIIDGDLGRIAVYVASSEEAYLTNADDTDASLKYSLAAKPSTGSFNDSVYLQASASTKLRLISKGVPATSGNEAVLSVGSLRLASSKVFPEDRPVADGFAEHQTVVGSSLQLVGSKSFDPSGRSLSYNWEVDVYPDGSVAAIQGAAHASTEILVGGIPVAVITSKRPTKKADGFTVLIEEGPANSLLALVWDSALETLTIMLGMDDAGNVTTTSGALVQAFKNPLAAGYNVEVSGGSANIGFVFDSATGTTTSEQVVYPGIFRAELAVLASAGTEILETGVYGLSGGSGSAMMNPIFIPDKPGVYALSLTVNNGVRDSFPSKVVFSATVTNQLLSHRPNSGYVWKYLSDFWKLVPDKDQITSVWSAMTQAVSSDLMTAWQNDYSKALKDTSRRYQRRWLHYDTRIDIPAGYTAYITQPDIITKQDMVVPEPTTINVVDTAITAESATIPFLTGKALLRTSLYPPFVVEVTGVVELPVATGATEPQWSITTSVEAFPVFEVLAERTGGYFVEDPSILVPQTPAKSTVLSDPTYPIASEADITRDVLRIYDELGENPQIVDIAEVSPSLTPNSVLLKEDVGGGLPGEIVAQTVDGFARKWDHLRTVENTSLEQTPYVSFGSELDLSAHTITLGDYLVISVVDPYTSSEISVSLPILAAGDQCVFVEWFPLLSALSLQATVSGAPKDWVAGDLVDVAITPKALVLARRLAKVTDLVSIPRLGTTSIVSDLQENFDYRITDGVISLVDWFGGTLSTVAGTNIVYPDTVVTHPDLATMYQETGTLQFVGEDSSLPIDTICLGAGDSSVYRIISYNIDGSLTLDRQLDHTAEKLRFWAPRYSAYRPGPDSLWAEVSYFDNWKTIENNFGLFIGLPKELVDSYDDSLDYLSVTKAVWFAFMSGPHFDNLQLAIQSMFDLPYAEAKGQIKAIDEPTDLQDGRILIEDEDGREYTYIYPRGADIATNPVTGNVYQALRDPLYWDLTLENGVYYKTTDGVLEVVSPDILAVMEDAKVLPYSKLVDVVGIEDYISDPDLIERQFGGNVDKYVDEYGIEHIVDKEPSIIEKYHKFVVEVPMDITQTTQVFPLVKSFLNEAKPAYTDFILVGSLKLSDEISVLDTVFLEPTLILEDTPSTSPFWAMASSPIPQDREDLIWPKEKTFEKVSSVTYPGLAGAAYLEFTLSDTNFWTQSIPTTNLYRLRLEASFAYGMSVDPPQAQVDPYQQVTANLTQLGAEIAGDQVGLYVNSCIGIFVPGDPYIHYVEAAVQWSNPIGTPANGSPIYMDLFINSSYGVDINALAPGSVLYFFGDLIAPTAALVGPAIMAHWDKEDVLEKYESGYCEGVLDDYSGDGSWNSRRTTLDMINTVNSDIDVLRSRLWVPVTKDIAGLQEDIEFEFGEPVDIYSDATGSAAPVVLDSGDSPIWDTAPPVILHIGAGVHPRIPAFDPADATKGIFSPQVEHPNTYLILGFDRSDTEDTHDWDNPPTTATENYNAYGDETRLDVIETVFNDAAHAGATLTLVGRRSGAIATIEAPADGTPVLSRSNTDHVAMPGSTGTRPYFLLETIWQQDKHIDYGPESDPTIFLTKFIPMDTPGNPPATYPDGTGGIDVADWWSATPTFDGTWEKTPASFGCIIDDIDASGLPIVSIKVPPPFTHHLIAGDKVHIWNTDQTTTLPNSVRLNDEYTVANVVSASEFEVNVGAAIMEDGTSGYLGHSPLYHLQAVQMQRELQQHPYDPTVALDKQFIPSTSPGNYSIWSSLPNPANVPMVWGYEDIGAIHPAGGNNLEDWDYSPHVSTYLQNIHFGVKVRAPKEYHFTQGFTEFFIPAPSIKMILALSAGYDIRLCGFYFCNDDPTRVDVPDENPDSYGDPTAATPEGIIGGSWVFFRNSDTGVETPVSNYFFETGINAGKIVGFLGNNRSGTSKFVYGGPDQPSDGHVLEFDIPAALPGFGYYDIIVRNYRPYQMKSGGAWSYHMDEDVSLKAFHHSALGWGITAWGTGTFGGV